MASSWVACLGSRQRIGLSVKELDYQELRGPQVEFLVAGMFADALSEAAPERNRSATQLCPLVQSEVHILLPENSCLLTSSRASPDQSGLRSAPI